jgi:Bacterial Ig domain
MNAFRLSTLTLSLAAALCSTSAYAILERSGPINTANGFPSWYQDTTGLSLELCLPLNQAELTAGSCLLTPGTAPVVPEIFPAQFFDEHFYWAGGAALTPATGGRANLTLALEAAFGTGAAAPGAQVVFTRIRVRFDQIPLTGDYRFIHPFGEETLSGVAGQRIFFTDDVGIGLPGDFNGAMNGRVGPYLLPALAAGGAELPPVAGPVAGKLYIADPAVLTAVTGSTLPPFLGNDGLLHNHNTFRIEGPAGSNIGGPGVDFLETNDFSLMGRVFTGQTPSLVMADRASYARTATAQKVDVFATAFATAGSRLPGAARPPGVAPITSFYNAGCGVSLDAAGKLLGYTAPVGALETLMVAQDTARWGQINVPVGSAIPDAVCLKDNSAVDIAGQQVPAFHPLPVNDEVLITQALFDPVASTMTVKAVSSDVILPPVLTLMDFNLPLVGGQVVVPATTAPPAKVLVLSSARGMDKFKVTASAVAGAASVVVAGNDVATTNEDTPVVIPVITGDTLNGVQIDPATQPITLAILVNGGKGTAVVNNLTGAISYTPRLNANGIDTFTYTVTVGGVASNIATVTVNITPVNDAPIAVADTAAGAINTPLVVNVLANDSDVDGTVLSIAPGSVTVPTGPAGSVSTAVANANGTITFTGNIAGPYRFNYRATDGVIATAVTAVNVTLAPAEVVVVSLPFDYRVAQNRWMGNGTSSIAAAHTVTLQLTQPLGAPACNANGRVIGTTTATANAYTFNIAPATGPLDPRTTNCTAIRVISSLGGVSLPQLFRLR